MKRMVFLLLVAIVVCLPVAATGSVAATGVTIRQIVVNPNNTITVNWALDNEDVFNDSLEIDGRRVKAWSGLNRSTSFTTRRPLTPGRHRVTMNVQEIFHTNTYYETADCDISRTSYLYICSWGWDHSRSVTIPATRRSTQCVVPNVTGLLLWMARQRVKAAKCAVGAVTRVRSARGEGTVLTQRPKAGKKLPRGAVVDLVVSNGQ